MFKKIIAGIASVSLALGMVALTAGPAAADAPPPAPIVGVVGTQVASTPENNNPNFWTNYGPHDYAQCFSHSGNSEHGSITNDGKTVTLNTFNQSWPGDHWELLAIKAGSDWVWVTIHPVAGVAYASPPNSSGNQANVSHWIVCKGTNPTPEDAAASVNVGPPNCDAAGSVTFGLTNATWSSTPPTTPGTHTITAVATDGHLFPGGVTTQAFTYTILAQLDPLQTECLDPVVPAATAIEPTCEVDYESQIAAPGPSFVRVFWNEGIASYTIQGYGTVTRPGDAAVLYTDVDTGNPGETLTITSTVLPGYAPTVAVTVTFGPKIVHQCGLIGDPIPTDETCVRGTGQGGSLWVERQEGLSYTVTGGGLVNPIVVSGLGVEGDLYLDGVIPLEPGDYTVSTAALPGYVLEPDELDNLPMDFTIHAPLENCVVVVTINCAVDEAGQFTVPALAHVVWTVDVPSDGNPPLFVNVPGGFTIPVTIAATYISASLSDPGFVFSNPLQTSWYLQLTEGDAQCGDLITLPPIPTAVSVTDEQCVSGKKVGATLTVGQVDDENWFPEVNYYLDGSLVPLASITTAITAGDHVVTAVPVDPDDTIAEGFEDSWEFTVVAAPTTCGDLTTLALTGGANPIGWAGIGYYLLITGLALIAVRTVRRRSEVQ